MISAFITDHSVTAEGWEVLGNSSMIPPFNFSITDSPSDALMMMETIVRGNEVVGMDTEANALDWEMPTTAMHGFSMAGEDMALYVYGRASIDQAVLDYLTWIINNHPTAWYNINYDLHILEKYGVVYEWNGMAHDIYIMSRLNNRGDNFSDGGLKGTAYTYLDHENLPTIKKYLSQYENDINNIPIEILGRYGAFDSRITYDLFNPLRTILQQEEILGKAGKTLWDYYLEEHLTATEGTYRMERNGMHIDVDFLREIDAEALSVIEKTGSFWERATGCNMNSSVQKSWFFFNVMGHKAKKKTTFGKGSTEASVMRDLALEGDVWADVYVNTIAPANKVRSTYIQPFLERTTLLGKPWIHGSFTIPRARTGRTASSDPNLQNIPARGKWGKYMRQVFNAPDGYKFLRADYSQLELRVLAHFTQDPAWLDMFMEGGDPHQLTADTVGVSRDQAKVVNFGIIYGMSPKALAINMKEWGAGNFSEAEAGEIIDTYFSNFGATKGWMDRVHHYARQLGYVQTILGRKRWLPEINGRNPYERSRAERQAVNTIIQGSAADIMNRGIINTMELVDNYNAFDTAGLPMMLADVVHDEIGVYVPVNEYTDSLAVRVGVALMNAGHYCGMIVPLVAEPELGDNWMEVK